MGFKEFFQQHEFAIKGLKNYMPDANVVVPASITKTGKRGGAHMMKPYAAVNPSRPAAPKFNRIFTANQTQKRSGIMHKG